MKHLILALALALTVSGCKNSENNNIGSATPVGPGFQGGYTGSLNPNTSPVYQGSFTASNSGVYSDFVKQRVRALYGFSIWGGIGSYGWVTLTVASSNGTSVNQPAQLMIQTSYYSIPVNGQLHTINGGANLEFTSNTITGVLSSPVLTSPMTLSLKFNGTEFATTSLQNQAANPFGYY